MTVCDLDINKAKKPLQERTPPQKKQPKKQNKLANKDRCTVNILSSETMCEKLFNFSVYDANKYIIAGHELQTVVFLIYFFTQQQLFHKFTVIVQPSQFRCVQLSQFTCVQPSLGERL